MTARKIFLGLTAFVISASAYSQTDTTTRLNDTTAKKAAIEKTNITSNGTQVNQDSTISKTELKSTQTTATAASGTSANDITVPKPNHGRYYIPVLGSYHSEQTGTEAKTVSVTPDEENPGKVWVEGLTETRFYALLKSVPGTYKIPAQNQEDKTVAEGEIQYDETNKSISICVGCGFPQKSTVEQTPVTTSTAKNAKPDKSVKKAKSNIINFTGVKTDTGSVSVR